MHINALHITGDDGVIVHFLEMGVFAIAYMLVKHRMGFGHLEKLIFASS
ncbi:hypothetical protein SAMN05216417_1359 [Nitrosospira multiformis]|jgi:hypothetical protein|uniref:Uncharacterized protein n=1 Tax=Nitrosospira multiformis TaxID=1231 RepID=A0A1I7IZZ3_9PROT|nr:hypothetical protein SAMN05216417_1359 [Nitrosospira multiformis]